MKINEIKTNKKNPRKISGKNLKKLASSITEFKEMMELRPIIVDENNTILGGNMRYQALVALKYEEIPEIWVKKIENLTEEQKKEFVVKDNLGYGEWDYDVLFDDYNFNQLSDWGFEVPEHIKDKTTKVVEDNFEIPEKIKTDIKEGDIFQIGNHRLICGDSTSPEIYKKLLGSNLADLVVTDPPYNVDYTGGTKEALKIQNDKQTDSDFSVFLDKFYNCTIQSMKPGAGIYVWHADMEGLNFRKSFKNSGLKLASCIIWVKNSMIMGRSDYQWKHEPCLYGWKPGASHYFTPDRTNTTVFDDKLDFKKLKKEELLKIIQEVFSEQTKTTIIYHNKPQRSEEHPTMKPVLLMAELIRNSSKQEYLVLDPFLGSGSTMVASHQLNRRCYGIELDPKYCQVIIDRMKKLDFEIEIIKL